MPSNRLISCIVPAYNGERFLAEAIDSIFAQSYQSVEVIVVDDGSTDGTSQVAANYIDRLLYIRQPMAGPPATRNRGLCAASGEFIAFLDADDKWHPEKLTRQMAQFAARPELDVSVTQMQNFWVAELHDEEQRLRGHPRTQPLPGYITGTMLAKRQAFESVGQFNPELWFGDAADWFLRAESHGIVVELLSELLAYHRMHPGNISRRKAAESKAEFLQIAKARLDRRRHASK